VSASEATSGDPIVTAGPADPTVVDDAADARTLHHLVALARRRLTNEAWDSLSGGAESETTLLRNRLALDSLGFNARVLRDVSEVDVRGRLLGQALRLPVVLAPVGSIALADPDGAAAAARAAARFGTIAFVSSVASPSLEEVAATGATPLVSQLYVRGDTDWIGEQVRRAERAGCVAVCLTVDSAVYARRERDLVNGTLGRGQSGDRSYQATMDWDTVRRTVAATSLPVIVKGVTHPEDAERAVAEGARAVHVSNHGGRQLDHAPATIDQLPDVVAAVAGRADVIVDGGFLRGSDVVKALALGADAVAIGKLQVWSLAAGGAAGLTRALELLELEVRMTMALLGVTSIAELEPATLRPVAPVRPPGILSAFPLLEREFPGLR
jgi:isopentenyl diphosphate isomerase/L-lactate dehydrogenase-like FMN-dependent dehydrogenase